MVCTFFGHSECFGLNKKLLKNTIEKLINEGVDKFYVGNQGTFDSTVLECLIDIQKLYSHIEISVVLAYLPNNISKTNLPLKFCIYPEGIEIGPHKFAIHRRNNWMIEQSDFCICFIEHTWGGAYKYSCKAKSRGLTVINIGSLVL